jgi:thiol:disulfide interchange protein DsbC
MGRLQSAEILMKFARRISTTALALAALSCVSVLHAEQDGAASRLQHTLEERFPTIKITAVLPSPVPGIYEVITGDRIAYSDPSGDYLFVGRLMDTRTRSDLNEQLIDSYNSIDFHKLPFDKAIKIIRGDGRRQLAVFADPDCPYCQELEKNMRSVTDVTVYVFLLPLEQLHPQATAHAHAIWCAPDRSKAWTDWVIDRKAPPAKSCQDDPVGAIRVVAQSLRINATPTLFLENGQRIGSAVSAERLQKLLAQASLGASPVAALREAATGNQSARSEAARPAGRPNQ